jgi:hypothetical protein
MNIDFLWQNAVWLAIGLAASKLWRWLQTRVRHRRLRRFFGADALGKGGIAITVPVLRPLSADNFDSHAQTTIALKTDDAGRDVRRPIYGEVLHLNDYDSAEEMFALLRELGATRAKLLQDSEPLGRWDENPCLICLGSPFVNATIGELLRLAEDAGSAPISGSRVSDTLDTYRVVVDGPERLTLGVDEQHALGVIARLPHPSREGNWVIGVWGCRAESTLAAARYLHREFRQIAGLAEVRRPLIVLLAIRGQKWDRVDVMYAASDRVLSQQDELLRIYDRPKALLVAAPVTGC